MAADSSSIILLQKSQLLDVFLRSYRVSVAQEVYAELTEVPKQGSGKLQQVLRSRRIAIKSAGAPQEMGDGEGATIATFLDGICDFILLDDRRAAQYCMSRDIPFVNSLLISRILCSCGAIDENKAAVARAALLQHGYYSRKVITQAMAFADADLSKFHP